MTLTVIRGVLGQLAHQDEEVIGVIRNIADNKVTFIHIPWVVAERFAERLGAPLLAPGNIVELTGHLCDHGNYLVVTDATAPT